MSVIEDTLAFTGTDLNSRDMWNHLRDVMGDSPAGVSAGVARMLRCVRPVGEPDKAPMRHPQYPWLVADSLVRLTKLDQSGVYEFAVKFVSEFGEPRPSGGNRREFL